MELHPDQGSGLSRRELMKRGLRTGAYVAPVVLGASVVAPVSAQQGVSMPTRRICTQPITYLQDFTIAGAAPNKSFNVFYRLSNSATFIQAPTQITTDAFGFGGISPFPITVDTSVVTSVTLVATIPGQPASTPTNPIGPPTVSNIVTVLSCTNGGMSAPGLVVAAVYQEPTTCPGGVSAKNYLDVGLFNAIPNTSYDIYLQPNTTGLFALAASGVTTNAQGNVTTFVTLPASATLATSYTVNAVLTGAPATPASFTSTAQLPTPLRCPAAIAARIEDYKNVEGHALNRP